MMKKIEIGEMLVPIEILSNCIIRIEKENRGRSYQKEATADYS